MENREKAKKIKFSIYWVENTENVLTVGEEVVYLGGIKKQQTARIKTTLKHSNY